MHFTDEPEHVAMLRESLRRFAAQEAPREKIREWDKACTFSRDVFHKLGDLGVCGLTVPEEYGGQGRDIVAAIATIEELARAGGAQLAAPYIHCAFYGGLNLAENGSPEQKARFLPRVAEGRVLFGYGLSEPDVGGDLASVATTARRRDDGNVVINGTKRWLTAAREADYIFCLVKSDPDLPRYKNLSMVLVPADAPGITIQDIDHGCIRFADTTDTIFDDVVVAAENILGGEAGWNNGWTMLAGPALDVEKLETAASALGIAWAAVDDAWRYAQERKQFGKVISGHQAVRFALVDAKTRLQACRHMLYHAAWLAGEGRPCSVETSMAKLFIADSAVEIVLSCQRVMGAYGLAHEYDMERYVRDITCFPIVGGSSNMQRNNIAARLKLAS